jgi:hypothetical protein
MWKHRLERKSPRKLSPAIERQLKKRRDGLWGLELKLRQIISTWIDDPGEWADIMDGWIRRHSDPVRIYTLLEILILEWITDSSVDDQVRDGLVRWMNHFDKYKWYNFDENASLLNN